MLADRGLADAVRALALDTPLRTETDVDLPGRLDPPVESACYFAVAEALTNAVKHSGARQAQVRIRHARGMLRVDGHRRRRAAAPTRPGAPGWPGSSGGSVHSTAVLAVSSPPGGPTIDRHRGAMRVVLAEDLFLLRDGLIRLLEAHDFDVIAAVGRART